MTWFRAPLLIREVFQIHTYFISITLAIFGILTWRFAGEIATAAHPFCVWLAIGIGCFWSVSFGDAMVALQFEPLAQRSAPNAYSLDALSRLRRAGSGLLHGGGRIRMMNQVRIVCRVALGLVWLLRRPRPETALRSLRPDRSRGALGPLFRTPEFFLQLLGAAQVVCGIWLLAGFAERLAVFSPPPAWSS